MAGRSIGEVNVSLFHVHFGAQRSLGGQGIIPQSFMHNDVIACLQFGSSIQIPSKLTPQNLLKHLSLSPLCGVFPCCHVLLCSWWAATPDSNDEAVHTVEDTPRVSSAQLLPHRVGMYFGLLIRPIPGIDMRVPCPTPCRFVRKMVKSSTSSAITSATIYQIAFGSQAGES